MSKSITTAVICSESIAGSGSPAFHYYGPFLVEKADSFSVTIVSATGTDVTYDINYSLCNSSDGTFIVPTGATLIADDKATAATGDMLSFTPVLGSWMKIGIKNNHATTALVINALLNWQEHV